VLARRKGGLGRRRLRARGGCGGCGGWCGWRFRRCLLGPIRLGPRERAGGDLGDQDEVDVASLGVNADDAHLHLVLELHDVFDALDALSGLELRDVDHAAEAEEVHEGAVRDDPDDAPQRDGADAGQRARRGAGRDTRRGEAVGAPAAELEARAPQGLRIGRRSG
jgi:hypothetical protein